ncbi:TatD family hydrolase [Avrilella dinanensis]|uniref:TatD family hydrolase n=1 Tax=Avrilella dinanensis TaxID=2008672 RepID=UPI0024099A36|nr:TatD family hydrolase [Avrilella dinanensis]
MWINIHTHRPEKERNIFEIVNKFPEDNISEEEYFSVGIHPWYINENWQKQLDLVREKIALKNCLAVGECGLDKLSKIPIEIQKEVFIHQLDIAQTLNKPLIIHCVRAYQELMEICSAKKINIPVVIHGFAKNTPLANQLLQKGFYLSFGKMLLHSPNLQETFVNCPENRLFFETDNAEIDIQSIYRMAKKLKGKCLKNQLKENVNRVFQLNLHPNLKK